MPKLYKYKDTSYNNIYSLQEALVKENTFISSQCKDEQLKELGIEVEEVPEDLAALKQRKLRLIGAWTANKIVGGFTSSASGEPVTYDSDKDTQLTMQGIALNVNTPTFAEKYPQGCPVRGYAEGTKEKAVFFLTPEQVLTWCADLSIHIGSCKQAGWEKQTEVAAAISAEELDKVKLEG